MKQFRISNNNNTKLKLFGISSMEKSYKLCWELNREYKFHFVHAGSHRVFDDNKQAVDFLLFKDDTYYPQQTCYILENKTNGNVLSKQYEIADYFFLIKDSAAGGEIENLRNKVSDLAIIQTVIAINTETLKDRQRFLIDE